MSASESERLSAESFLSSREEVWKTSLKKHIDQFLIQLIYEFFLTEIITIYDLSDHTAYWGISIGEILWVSLIG